MNRSDEIKLGVGLLAFAACIWLLPKCQLYFHTVAKALALRPTDVLSIVVLGLEIIFLLWLAHRVEAARTSYLTTTQQVFDSERASMKKLFYELKADSDWRIRQMEKELAKALKQAEVTPVPKDLKQSGTNADSKVTDAGADALSPY